MESTPARTPVTDEESDVDPRSLDGLDRRALFGLQLVDAPDLDVVVEALLGHGDRHLDLEPGVKIDAGVLPIVVTPNVDILVALDAAPNSLAAEVFRRAQYVLPDGMPLVAASRLLGRPLAARLPGSGLFEQLWPRLTAENRPVVVLCANDGIVQSLRRDHPTARFLVPPFVEADDDEQITIVAKEAVDLATEIEAEYVLVGLGHPKDAQLMVRMHRLWRASRSTPALCLGLGGSFAMYVGQKRRAPVWMQRSGLEWFYRFVQEPRRLFRRYFIEDLAFVGIVRRERRSATE